MKDLVIFGAGGFGREVLQIVLDQNEDQRTWNFLGFLDGNPDLLGKEIHGFPVLGGAEWLRGRSGVHVAVAVGNPAVKKKIVREILEMGENSFATLIHPDVWIGRNVFIDPGTIICSGNRITTDIRIGAHVILNLNCTVGHDAIIEDFATLYPGVHVSGNVHLEEGAEIGTGTAIIQGVRVGAWTTVGAGAAVVRDLPPGVVAVGVPAKVIKEKAVST